MKSLLLKNMTNMLSLKNWELYLRLMSLNSSELITVYMQMLKDCKFSKFREINFKILAQILLMPKIIAAIKKDPNLALCKWCGFVGTLEHMLFECFEVWKARHDFVRDNRKLLGSWREKYWILSTKQANINQIIWVVNFAVYKAFL